MSDIIYVLTVFIMSVTTYLALSYGIEYLIKKIKKK